MTSNKTVPTTVKVKDFLKTIDDPQQRKDCQVLKKMMQNATGKRAKMWGSSIIGFGEYHYKYDSGREGDHILVGFAPRKKQLVLYIMPGFKLWPKHMNTLGKYKTGKSCLYIKKLADVDLKVLDSLVSESVVVMRERYDCQ
ncbi:MAG: DUF1801 domain-containing protein [Pseudomonadota bacterium]